jgi:hypothetical protein
MDQILLNCLLTVYRTAGLFLLCPIVIFLYVMFVTQSLKPFIYFVLTEIVFALIDTALIQNGGKITVIIFDICFLTLTSWYAYDDAMRQTKNDQYCLW